MAVIATRREKVILELEDNFSSGMARAAAATALLDGSLDRLSGSAVRSRTDLDRVNEPLPVMAKNSALADRSINQLTGRLRLMADAAAILGPALVPIGAAAVPALAGMATQLLLTAAAAGTAALAFQGIGDGVKALNEYQLEPTAENFQKMQIAMENLGPAGADFVRFLDDVAPKFQQLQMTAREGMFPGIEDGITHLLDLLPQVDSIVREVSEAMGQLASEAGAGLSGAGFTAFFNYLETDAKDILLDMGRTVGEFAEGIGNLVVAFSPLTSDFSSGLLGMAEGFSAWSASLQDSQGFQEFLSYVQEAGPMVMDFVGSLANAFASIVEAAAPVGTVVLPVLTKFLDVIAAIADSPAGSALVAAAAGMTVWSRSASLAAAAGQRLGTTGTTGLQRFNAVASRSGQGVAGIAAISLALTDLDDKAGVSNTAMLTLAGTMVGGPWGAAAGAVVGSIMDITAANDALTASVDRASRAFAGNNVDEQTASLKALREEIQKAKEQSDISDSIAGGVPLPNMVLLRAAKSAFLQFGGSVEEAERKLSEFKTRADVAGDLRGLLVGPLNLTSDAFDAATQSAKEFSKAVGSAFAILDKRAALRGAADAIDSFNRDLKDTPKHLKPGTQAYRDMRASLDDIARTSLTAAQHLKGMNRVNFLDKQRDQFVDAAQKLGYTGKEARALADDLGLVNKTKVQPKIKADNSDAKQKIDETNNWLGFLGKKVATPSIQVMAGDALSTIAAVGNALGGLDGRTSTTYVRTIHTTSQGKSIPQGADGMTVPGQRQPYGDKTLAWLAPGEEVISNRYGQADRFRADRAAGRIPHYADGGQVQRMPSSSSTHITVSAGAFSGTLRGDGFMAAVDARIDARVHRAINSRDQFERDMNSR